jgi:DNA-binding NarL/FixJ family response regulator
MASESATRKPTIVIIEDNPAMRYAIERTIADTCEVLDSAEDGAAGVQAVEQHQPDIVLLDVSLPKLNGFEAAERIAAKCPRPIIFVSNHTEPVYVLEAYKRGAAGYVPKSNMQQIREAISAVLDGARYFPTLCR